MIDKMLEEMDEKTSSAVHLNLSNELIHNVNLMK